jgi:cytoplasmic tRNA 2-thiolation protein 1
MAKLVPEAVTGISHCKSQKVSLSSADGEEEGAAGCGTNGRSSGGEMADMEEKLREDEEASSREINLTATTSNEISGQRHDRRGAKTEPRNGEKREPGKKLTRQTLGTCKKCGYMSSQDICKACMLLEGLNKNRPKIEIEVDVKDEESSTLRRRMEGLALAAG